MYVCDVAEKTVSFQQQLLGISHIAGADPGFNNDGGFGQTSAYII